MLSVAGRLALPSCFCSQRKYASIFLLNFAQELSQRYTSKRYHIGFRKLLDLEGIRFSRYVMWATSHLFSGQTVCTKLANMNMNKQVEWHFVGQVLDYYTAVFGKRIRVSGVEGRR